jgi:nitroimidazol reductase NimA-like FMN-containing flavoprotein (pyridoxamine 5'-phosphate oxidase superfamily)
MLGRGTVSFMRRKEREVTDINGIEEILKQCKTCHVAMVDDGLPYLVPLSFGYKFFKGNVLELYFHSAFEGRKLDVLRRNNKVCFEMSHEGEPVHSETPCNSGYYYASVIGFGEVMFIEPADEKGEALSVMVKHQSGRDATFTAEQTKSVCVFKIVSTDFTGKRKPGP